MELRQLRYFLRVAETLHFGRAAEQENIAASVVSTQISRLERELGMDLFRRTSRRVTLTLAGDSFREHAENALSSLDAGTAAARRSMMEMQRLRVGSFADDPLTHRFLSTFRSRYPRVPLSYVELSISHQVSSVIEGDVDLAFVWLPVDDPRVTVDPLYSEMPVAALSSTHRLANEARVHVDDLLGDSFALAAAGTPREWRAHWSLDAYRGGPPLRSIEVSSARESLAAVAYSGTVDTMSTNSAALWNHPGVRFLPLPDARPTSLALISAADSREPLVQAFREVVADVVSSELDAVPGAVSLVS